MSFCLAVDENSEVVIFSMLIVDAGYHAGSLLHFHPVGNVP